MVKDTNLKALEKRYNDIFSKLKECEIDNKSCVEVELARNGEPILVIHNQDKKIYMNSKYNPTNEAHRFMKPNLELVETALVVMFGLGTGSFLRECLSLDNSHMFLVYEPSLLNFLKVIECVDISDILLDKRVLLFVKGINEHQFGPRFMETMSVANANYNKFVTLPKYKELFEEQHAFWLREIGAKMEYAQAEINTFVWQGHALCEAGIRNMKYMHGSRSIEDYCDIMPKDIPVIIVAAGPSLQDNVDKLVYAKGKAFIFAVDHAVSALLTRNIIPDAIMAVDTFKPPELFDYPEVQDIPMIIGMGLNPKALKVANAKNIIFQSSSAGNWQDLFKQQGSSLNSYTSEGSVALDAMKTAIHWGFSTIIMVGQDLAFKDRELYVDKQRFGKDEISDEQTTYVKDIHGNMILTKKNLCIYKKGIEDMALAHPEVTFVDATEGGALIEHSIIMTLMEAIDKYCTKSCDMNEILTRPARLFMDMDVVKEELIRMKHNLTGMREQFEEGRKRCAEGEKLLGRKEYNVARLKRINAVIEKTNLMFDNLREAQFVNLYAAQTRYEFFLDYNEVEQDHIKESLRSYKKLTSYYAKMSEVIPSIISIIDETIESCEM
ncbi:MAG: DUF115 domain-containing protein [Lachnospiraceae bacterium]|nr:DUF115 domain-containing protein [Lachnospiraceae bacterium]